MYRYCIPFLLVFSATFSVFGQTDSCFKKCGETKLKRQKEIFSGGYSDTTTSRLIIQNEIQWKNCIENCNIPEFSTSTITGETVDSKKLLGKVIVINFWYIGCSPCAAEFPALNRLVKDYEQKGVIFIAFATDTKSKLTPFLKKYKFDFEIIPSSKKVFDTYGVEGCPVTFIIDQSGKVKKVWTGGYTDERAKTAAYDKAKPVIDDLLNTN